MSEGIDDFGLVIAGHGSRDADGTREFEEALMLLQQRQPDRVITHGFLEFATPTIDEALRKNARMGSRKIVMVPGILFAASHGKNDMPVELLSVKPECVELLDSRPRSRISTYHVPPLLWPTVLLIALLPEALIFVVAFQVPSLDVNQFSSHHGFSSLKLLLDASLIKITQFFSACWVTDVLQIKKLARNARAL